MILAAVVALVATGLACGASAQSITLKVDCAKGQKIGDAIARGDASKPLTIIVRGTCNESVRITRDDVTLRGETVTGATVHGPDSTVDTIAILADRVTIDRLTVTGGRYGIENSGGFNTEIIDSRVEDTSSHGISVYVGNADITRTTVLRAGGHGMNLARGAVLRVTSAEIRNCAQVGINGQSSTQLRVYDSTIVGNGAGIALSHVSSGAISGSTISSNGTFPGQAGTGILVEDSKVLAFDHTVIADNTNAGVVLRGGKLNLQSSTISGNGSHGVNAYLGSVLDIFMSDISHNSGNGILCMLNCTAVIYGGTIQNNSDSGISLVLASKLHLAGPVTDATGNGGAGGLYCNDRESSAFDLAFLNGPVGPSCTGY
jgi:hypothetical protein